MLDSSEYFRIKERIKRKTYIAKKQMISPCIKYVDCLRLESVECYGLLLEFFYISGIKGSYVFSESELGTVFSDTYRLIEKIRLLCDYGFITVYTDLRGFYSISIEENPRKKLKREKRCRRDFGGKS